MDDFGLFGSILDELTDGESGEIRAVPMDAEGSLEDEAFASELAASETLLLEDVAGTLFLG